MKVNVKTNKSCIGLVATIPLKKIGMIEKQGGKKQLEKKQARAQVHKITRPGLQISVQPRPKVQKANNAALSQNSISDRVHDPKWYHIFTFFETLLKTRVLRTCNVLW